MFTLSSLWRIQGGSQQSKHLQGKRLALDAPGGVLVLQGVDTDSLQGALVVVGNEKQQSSIELASESISLTERDEANEITK